MCSLTAEERETTLQVQSSSPKSLPYHIVSLAINLPAYENGDNVIPDKGSQLQ